MYLELVVGGSSTHRRLPQESRNVKSQDCPSVLGTRSTDLIPLRMLNEPALRPVPIHDQIRRLQSAVQRYREPPQSRDSSSISSEHRVGRQETGPLRASSPQETLRPPFVLHDDQS